MQDGFRVLSCSKDYSIRVYKWVWPDESSVTTPQLHSRYHPLKVIILVLALLEEASIWDTITVESHLLMTIIISMSKPLLMPSCCVILWNVDTRAVIVVNWGIGQNPHWVNNVRSDDQTPCYAFPKFS